MEKKLVKLFISIGFLFLAGCTISNAPHDPYENFNRKIYSFNRVFDKVILKPVAKTYNFILPNPIRKGINNFFFNISETVTIVNDLLQLDASNTLADTWRLVINTTVGIGGLFDVASHVGLPRHYNDLGVTFAKWGAKDAPYIMLPILGPSTITNGLGLAVEYYELTIFPYLRPDVRLPLIALLAVDLRSRLLPADKAIQQSFDPYVFVRNAYFQYRARLLQRNESQDTYVTE